MRASEAKKMIGIFVMRIRNFGFEVDLDINSSGARLIMGSRDISPRLKTQELYLYLLGMMDGLNEFAEINKEK